MSKSVTRNNSKVCSLEECGKTFTFMGDLILHLEADHQLKVNTENLSFSSEKNFLVWKTQVENEVKMLFLLLSGRKRILKVER